MTVLNFPPNPADGATYTENGITYTWNANGTNEGFWSANGEAINLQTVTDNGNRTDNGIEFQNTANNQQIEINADDATGSYTLTLPPTAGTASQVLAIDTVSGSDLELDWTDAGGSGTVTSISVQNGISANQNGAAGGGPITGTGIVGLATIPTNRVLVTQQAALLLQVLLSYSSDVKRTWW